MYKKILFLFVLSLFNINSYSQYNNFNNKELKLIKEIEVYIKNLYLNDNFYKIKRTNIKINKNTGEEFYSYTIVNNNNCYINIGEDKILKNNLDNFIFLILHEYAHCIVGNSIKSDLNYSKEDFVKYQETFADLFVARYFLLKNQEETIIELKEYRKLTNEDKKIYLFPYVFEDLKKYKQLNLKDIHNISENIVKKSF